MRTLAITLIVACISSTCASRSSADVITFGPGPIGSPVAPTVEGIFIYDTFSGALFRDTQGNGDGFNMEGLSGTGGVLRVVRNDIASGIFTFDQSDVALQFNQSVNIDFEGFLLGVSQGMDSFLTTADSAYSTQASSVLSGVTIDELRVTLATTPTTATVIDNLVLTPIPEPSALITVGAALLSFGLFARRRR